MAVNDKTFAYLSLEGDPLSISCKLPQSSDEALSLPFTAPTGYGLGKSGWVSATFEEALAVPVDLLKQWIDESYRAQAPKRLSRGLAPFSPEGPAERPAVENAEQPRVGKKRAAQRPAKKPVKAQAAAQRRVGKKRK